MQFQSGTLGAPTFVPQVEELPGIGVIYAARSKLGTCGQKVFGYLRYGRYDVKMDNQMREKMHHDWQEAVGRMAPR